MYRQYKDQTKNERTTSTYPKEERIESLSNDRAHTRKHAQARIQQNNKKQLTTTLYQHMQVSACLPDSHLSCLLVCLRARFTSCACVFVCAYLFVTLFNAIFTSHCVYDIVRADIRRPLKCSMIRFIRTKRREREKISDSFKIAWKLIN